MISTIHDRAEEWIAAALTGGLDPEEARAFDLHLSQCGTCRQLYAEEKAMSEIMESAFAEARPSTGFEQRTLAAFRRRVAQRRRSPVLALLGWLAGLRGVRIIAVATGLLALVGIGSVLTNGPLGRRRLLGEARDGVAIVESNGRAGVVHGLPGSPALERDRKGLDDQKESSPDTDANRNSLSYRSPSVSLTVADGATKSEGYLGLDKRQAGATPAHSAQMPAGEASQFNAMPGLSGTLTLEGGNTYAGGTTIAAGTLATAGLAKRSLGQGDLGAASNLALNQQKGVDLLKARGVTPKSGEEAKNSYAFDSTGATSSSGPSAFSAHAAIKGGAGGADTHALNENFSADTNTMEASRASRSRRAVVAASDKKGANASSVTAAPVVRSAASLGGALLARSSPAAAPAIPATAGAASGQRASAVLDADASTVAPDAQRKLVRTARVELEVARFDPVMDAITAAAQESGGYVATKDSARQANGKLRGTVEVRVAPENLDRFLAKLRELGEVKGQTLNTEDVTKAYFDAEAHLRNSTRMEERLLKMLADAKGKLSEVLQVEKELGRVREEIEKMQGELKLYDSLVQYATVTISLAEKDLNQPAAFLLKQTATLALWAADVEKTYADARRLAAETGAQVVEANVRREDSGQVSAILSLLVPPEAADGVIGRLKALGRLDRFTLEDQRVALDGSAQIGTGDAVPEPKVKRDQITVNLTIRHDEQTRRQASLTVVTKQIETAFEKAKTSAAEAGAEIVSSNLLRPEEGHGSAAVVLRVPSRNYSGLLEKLRGLGRAGNFEMRRDPGAEEADAGPVLISLTLAESEPAVQETSVRVLSAEVERQTAELKRATADAGGEVEHSSFERQTDGRETAVLTCRVPMGKYPAFMGRVKALGEVKDLAVRRQERASSAASESDAEKDGAAAEISVQIYSQGNLVADDTGVLATVRQTFGQGATALMWSVRMIGVALAFLAPWAAAGLAGWVGVRIARRGARSKPPMNANEH